MVVPHYPHHVTQRGNRKQRTFFCDEDYRQYLQLIAKARKKAKVAVWAYCLMPNHVHFVIVPETDKGLARFFSESHRLYTRAINAREGWQGHLWQERFHSTVMNEHYLIAAVRYVELNPVRAGLCENPFSWRWSSAVPHLEGIDDEIVTVKPMLDRISRWERFLDVVDMHEKADIIRQHGRSGRPLGGMDFVEKVEKLTNRNLQKKKTGPGPRTS